MNQTPDIYILGGSQTDFSRNWAREGKEIYDMFAESFCRRQNRRPATADPAAVECTEDGDCQMSLYLAGRRYWLDLALWNTRPSGCGRTNILARSTFLVKSRMINSPPSLPGRIRTNVVAHKQRTVRFLYKLSDKSLKLKATRPFTHFPSKAHGIQLVVHQ